MPKGILEFDLTEEREEFDDAVNGWKYKSRIDDIWQKVWRPRHKHGYNNERLNALCEIPEVDEAIDILEKIYQDTVGDD